MNAQAGSVIAHFGSANGLGGFAVHNYQNSYLTGAASWPVTNPAFPTNVVALTAIERVNGGSIRLSGVGVPNHSHTLQAATDPNTASFFFFTNITADNAGALHCDDTSVADVKARFYHLIFP